MPATTAQRPKLLYLAKIFKERTDELHPMSVKELIDALAAYDIQAERKSIYTDIKILQDVGLDIVYRRKHPAGHYLASRQFELYELQILVDAVQSLHILPEKKSAELIEKLVSLTSVSQARQLRDKVIIDGSVKALNESVYYNIDRILTAIINNKKISFKYFDYNPQKERVYRKKGEEYKTTPVSLQCKDDNYYLIVQRRPAVSGNRSSSNIFG